MHCRNTLVQYFDPRVQFMCGTARMRRGCSLVDQLSFFGVNPVGYHLVQVLIHTANALLLFALIKHVSGIYDSVFVAAAIFAVIPLYTDAVNWPADSPNSGDAVLFACRLVLARRSETGSRIKFIIALVFSLLAIHHQRDEHYIAGDLLLVDRLLVEKAVTGAFYSSATCRLAALSCFYLAMTVPRANLWNISEPTWI